MFVMSVERKNVVSSLFGSQTLKQAFTCSGNVFFFVFVTFAYVARTTPKTSPGKLTKLRTIKKKMKTLKSFKFSVLF